MGAKLTLRIVSPKGVLFDGEVTHATFPGSVAPFAVFPSHAPIITSLTEGEIKYHTGAAAENRIAVTGGFVKVNKNKITACVEV